MVAASLPAQAPSGSARPTSVTRVRAARVLAGTGAAGVAVAIVVIGVLHLIPPTSEISPLRRTISEYGLTSLAWAFDLGVLALVAGSIAVFAAQAVRRRLPVAAGVFGALWVIGLSTLVVFPKHNFALADAGGASGSIHRAASLVAFVAIPIGLLLMRAGRTVRWLAVLSLLWFAPILWAILLSGRRSWWTAIPLGLVERGLALTEVVALLALCAVAAARPQPAPLAPVQSTAARAV